LEARLETVVLLVGLVVSAVTDILKGKIYNVVTFPMMALGVVIHATAGEWWVGLLGIGGATIIHVPLWLARIQKAGDAKLMLGVGACVGWLEMVEATIWYAILFVPIALAAVAVMRRWSKLATAASHLFARLRGVPPGPPPDQVMIRVGPIIAAAGVIGWLTDLAVLH